MGLLKMSLSGAVFILAIALFRLALGKKLPRMAFVLLWWLSVVRLLLPFAPQTPFSIFSLLSAPQTVQAGAPQEDLWTSNPQQAYLSDKSQAPLRNSQEYPVTETQKTLFGPILWGIGFALCGVAFLGSHARQRHMLQEAVEVDDSAVLAWKGSKVLWRRFKVCACAKVDSPMTCGVVHPVILLPEDLAVDKNELTYVLEHEFAHIRSFDALLKCLLAAGLCIHWFNPAVWLMLVLANRDIEIGCDARVLQRLGDRAAYARALLSLEAHRSECFGTLASHFSHSRMEERILSIMKWKSFSKAAVAVALCAVCILHSFSDGDSVPSSAVSPLRYSPI